MREENDIEESKAELLEEIERLQEVLVKTQAMAESYKNKLTIAIEALKLIGSGKAVASDMSSYGKKFEDLQSCARSSLITIEDQGKELDPYIEI